jgi:hypothetical protein
VDLLSVTSTTGPRSEPHRTARSGYIGPMSTDSVTFRIDGEVEVSKLADALTKFTHALDVLRADADADVKWVIAGLEYGSASATARAIPRDQRSEERVGGMCRATST